jgi:hypothetical protein
MKENVRICFCLISYKVYRSEGSLDIYSQPGRTLRRDLQEIQRAPIALGLPRNIQSPLPPGEATRSLRACGLVDNVPVTHRAHRPTLRICGPTSLL